MVRASFGCRLAEEGVRLARAWSPRVVSAFYPLADEPDMLPLLSALADLGFCTALPSTVSHFEPLRFRAWRPGDQLIRGQMKILEPVEHAIVVVPELLFIPLAAFDRHGNRIGFGGGHFDRTLSRLRGSSKIRAVGVAYAVSEVPTAPAESHDERLDFVLTDKELIDCSEAR